MASSKIGVSRRRFLQSSAAAGIALSLPWLPGCGSEDDGSSASPMRHNATLHFDLSTAGHNGPFVLHAIGSRANKRHLAVHTPETRAVFRSMGELPQGISDARLTHFQEDVDLPVGAVQQIWVTAGAEPYARPVLAKIFCGGVDLAEQNWVSPRDMALALIFHHNEIVRLEPDQAATVCAHIDSSPLLDHLARAVEGLEGYDPFVPVYATDFDDVPVLDSDGEQFVHWDPSDELLVAADAVVKDVLGRIFDDPGLENANWHAASGRTSIDIEETSDLGAAPEAFEADYPADARNRSSAHGLYFTGLKLVDAEKRTVQLEVKNFWLRYLTAHVDFYNNSGFGVRSEEPPVNNVIDKDLFRVVTPTGSALKSRFLAVIGSNSDILGIPVLPEHQSPTILRFNIPPGASSAQVSFLTLGLGGQVLYLPPPRTLPNQLGSEISEGLSLSRDLTAIFNIGIPSLLLAVAVGTDPLTVQTLGEIARDKKLWAELLTLGTYKLYNTVTREDARPFLIYIGGKLVSLVLKSLPTLATKLAVLIGRQQLQQAVPFIGWGVKMASIAAATSKLSQTVGEVLSSPSIFQNKISLILTTRLTIRHDPANTTGFPATATRWEMQANYDGKISQKLSGTLPATMTDPIDLEFKVPSGGKGKIDIWFLTDTNWIAGHGTTGNFDNLASNGVIDRTITITENLVPLTAMTRYHHRQKLAFSNGQYAWQPALDRPPTQTAANLSCNDNSLCELNGIALSQTAAVAGYSWRARSQTLPLCGGNPTTSSLDRMQNVSFAQRPQDGLKRALCGYRGKPLLAYELRNAPGQAGRNFYIDPADGRYHLRAVGFDTSSFDQTSQMSWGRFSQVQSAVAIHPAGYAIGVNTQSHKLEILRLPQAPMPDAEVPVSVLKAGFGTRCGLLDTPSAVGVDLLKGAIFVLEGGNARIQAFDVHGNPVARFQGGTSEVRPLQPENGVTYLDMAVESTGWMYVLSFIGTGRNASDYRLDIYDPDAMGERYVSRTTGVAAGKMAVDLWRNLYTLNYEPLVGPDGLEPSLSQWTPSTPDGCDQRNNPFCQKL